MFRCVEHVTNGMWRLKVCKIFPHLCMHGYFVGNRVANDWVAVEFTGQIAKGVKKLNRQQKNYRTCAPKCMQCLCLDWSTDVSSQFVDSLLAYVCRCSSFFNFFAFQFFPLVFCFFFLFFSWQFVSICVGLTQFRACSHILQPQVHWKFQQPII